MRWDEMRWGSVLTLIPVPTPRYPKAISPHAIAWRGISAEPIDSMTVEADYDRIRGLGVSVIKCMGMDWMMSNLTLCTACWADAPVEPRISGRTLGTWWKSGMRGISWHFWTSPCINELHVSDPFPWPIRSDIALQPYILGLIRVPNEAQRHSSVFIKSLKQYMLVLFQRVSVGRETLAPPLCTNCKAGGISNEAKSGKNIHRTCANHPVNEEKKNPRDIFWSYSHGIMYGVTLHPTVRST